MLNESIAQSYALRFVKSEAFAKDVIPVKMGRWIQVFVSPENIWIFA